MKLDLHVHSAYSHDGIESIKKIIQTAQKRGLDGIAICDHNVFKAYEEAKDLAPEGFIVIPGIEYGTDVGHVLALFVTHGYDLKRDGRKMRSIAELRAAAKADGALLIAAHPFRKRNELPGLLIPNVDGVETMNSRDAAKAPLNSEKARRVAEKHGKFITGGSDAHILREIGACYTVLPD
ncbi:MAG: PHP domain-containing protein, partial [Clostridiales bacterium]|nr:PHP domain-containing protein [Clostridiales bacterium]